MNELLIKSPVKSNLNDTDSSTEKTYTFKFDPVKDTLEKISSRSIIQRRIAFILSKFVSCQIFIIFFSFIFGFLTLGLPLLSIYNSLVTNVFIPILIICIFALIFSIALIIMHIVDGNKHKIPLISKWERKNIFENAGISFTLMVLIISISLSIDFYSKAIFYQNDSDIILDTEEATVSKELESDYVFKYILNIIYFLPSDISENNENNKIKYYFSDEKCINILRKKLMSSLIPLLLISLYKIIKCFLIENFFFFWKFYIFNNEYCDK